jgi:hypothetical protein
MDLHEGERRRSAEWICMMLAKARESSSRMGNQQGKSCQGRASFRISLPPIGRGNRERLHPLIPARSVAPPARPRPWCTHHASDREQKPFRKTGSPGSGPIRVHFRRCPFKASDAGPTIFCPTHDEQVRKHF